MIYELTALWLAIPWGYRLLLVAIAAIVVMGIAYDWCYPPFDSVVRRPMPSKRKHKGKSGR